MSINKVMITGNLTRDPELRNTANGSSILSFGVAVNDRRQNAQGEWEDYANFVDCTMFGNRAQSMSKYLAKGTKVAIEGKLHYSTWEDKSGSGKRSKLEVYVDSIDLMVKPQAPQQAPQAAPAPQYATAPAPYPQTPQYAPQAAPQPAYPTQQVYAPQGYAPAPQAPQQAYIADDDIPF